MTNQAQAVSVGSRIRILRNRNPERIGKLATIVGERRPGRSIVTGEPNWVHPVHVDGVGRTVNGKPIAVEDGTFELVSGTATPVRDTESAAFALKLRSTGDADGWVDGHGVAHLDDER